MNNPVDGGEGGRGGMTTGSTGTQWNAERSGSEGGEKAPGMGEASRW